MISLSIDPERAKEFRSRDLPEDERVCTMCSQFCSMKKMDSILGKKRE
jgi:phosphomethylpyrimidine synthase